MSVSSGLKRNTIDKFYTNEETVKLCENIINNELIINYNKDFIIEPSAGNGSFRNVINNLCKNNIMIDIQPESDDIIECDYLKYIPEKINGKIHVIGNPPFGRQSSTALKFIKHSSKFCSSISFILPKSFKKVSLHDKIPLEFHLLKQVDIVKDSFVLNGKPYNVPCVFQIWIKKDIKRKKSIKLLPRGYKFVKKEDDHDISFQRVGGKAGKICTDTESKSIQSHYFIKFDKKIDLLKLQKIQFESNNTVGPKSISKQELIKKYNSLL